MRRLLSLAVLGVVAAGLMLATPATSQAQDHRGHGGSSASHYDRGFGGAYGNYGGRHVDRGYVPGYGGPYSPGYAPGYGGQYGGRGVIHHPTSARWTPNSGLHTHGQVHVPHRGYSQTRPH